MSSRARALPTCRVRRCEPPVPGKTPSEISGNPICPASRRARRRSHAIAISSPPPTVCPFRAAMTSFGVRSKRLSVSLACRQKLYLNWGVTRLSISISAPAEKNFSPSPRSSMTKTSSSNRACRIAWSNWIIISCEYVFAGGLSNLMRAIPLSAL